MRPEDQQAMLREDKPTIRPEQKPAMRPEEKLARRGGAIELLRFPAALFGAAAWTRRALYDRRLLPSTRLPVPVVCVGNITTGGTGKTPMCAWVVAQLKQRGFEPGLLSRGYGAVAGAANDEALLLERLCPAVPHVQDADRVRGGKRLVEEHSVDLIVLDDGFQHRRLARDVDIVLVDATRPWGLAPIGSREAVRALLPRGLLREPPSSLRRADAIVITRCEAVDAGALETLERTLQSIAPGRPLARARMVARCWRDERGVESPLADLAGRDVDVISALGNPVAFEASVRSTGARVRDHRVFPDHHTYSAQEARTLSASGRELVTSAKDAVKLAPLGVRFRALESELEITSGAAVLDALLDTLPRARS
jgi:tetraacyldisaccharide 4'-kinase